MFSYFGGKAKLAHLYPRPLHDTIIEPFAGSARYALLYPDREVILIDRYKVIVDIWNWLINKACTETLLSLPRFRSYERIEHEDPVIRNFLAFQYCQGTEGPRIRAGAYRKPSESNFREMGKMLERIRHWKVIHGNYTDAPDIEATWYIDPPYQHAGTRYFYGSQTIDYKGLGQWCRSRRGQVIVCENMGATWLPFERLTTFQGQKTVKDEAIYYQVNGVAKSLYGGRNAQTPTNISR